MGEWTLFSNHGHVLVCLANNHQSRLRDVAAEVGITERAVQNILRELQDCGMVQISKHGRCNHYQINTRKALRHPLEAHCTVGKLLQLLKSGAPEESGIEIAVERPANTRKKQSSVKPGRAAPSAASSSKTVQVETAAKDAKDVAPRKPLSDLPTRQAIPDKPRPVGSEKTESAAKTSQQSLKNPAKAAPAKKEAEESQSEKKSDKDEKKKIPASDQQGSLF